MYNPPMRALDACTERYRDVCRVHAEWCLRPRETPVLQSNRYAKILAFSLRFAGVLGTHHTHSSPVALLRCWRPPRDSPVLNHEMLPNMKMPLAVTLLSLSPGSLSIGCGYICTPQHNTGLDIVCERILCEAPGIGSLCKERLAYTPH